MIQRCLSGVLLAVLLSVAPLSASAVSFGITPSAGLLEGGSLTILCDDCLLGPIDFGLGASSLGVDVSGSLTFVDPEDDGTGTATLTLNIDVPFTLTEQNGEVNGVASIVFSSMSYQLADAAATWDGSSLVANDLLGDVAGSYTQDGSGGAIGALGINDASVRMGLNCLESGGVLDCGLSVNALSNTLPISVGGTGGFELRQAINFSGSLPEPGAGLLMIVGLLGMAARRHH
jgi:hypothetical protein